MISFALSLPFPHLTPISQALYIITASIGEVFNIIPPGRACPLKVGDVSVNPFMQKMALNLDLPHSRLMF